MTGIPRYGKLPHGHAHRLGRQETHDMSGRTVSQFQADKNPIVELLKVRIQI